MTIDEQLKLLAEQECPQEIDVVDKVMSRIESEHGKHIQPSPAHSRAAKIWRYAGITAAAAVVALVAVNILFVNNSNNTIPGVSPATGNQGQFFATIEDAAVEDTLPVATNL